LAELKTEEEQIEAITRWWKEKGLSTVFQVIAVAALYFGWQGWQNHQQQNAEAASVVYQQLLDVNAKIEGQSSVDHFATAAYLVTTLKVDYEDLTYAQYAAMISAKLLNSQEKYSDAIQELDWVIASKPEQPILLAATLRKARVISNSGDNAKALAVLDVKQRGQFAAAFYELEGDLQFAMGDLAAAKNAYQQAANNLAMGTGNPLLTIKLDSLVVADSANTALEVVETDAEES
jgi:predicted negative regulator of RcsB-dependent stress response|tara:strand:- start:3045 stop:3746 length:702 start_codon:yes stop_codon:yes gene_type:complete